MTCPQCLQLPWHAFFSLHQLICPLSSTQDTVEATLTSQDDCRQLIVQARNVLQDLLGENFRRQMLMDGQYGSITFICTKTDVIQVNLCCMSSASVSQNLACLSFLILTPMLQNCLPCPSICLCMFDVMSHQTCLCYYSEVSCAISTELQPLARMLLLHALSGKALMRMKVCQIALLGRATCSAWLKACMSPSVSDQLPVAVLL